MCAYSHEPPTYTYHSTHVKVRRQPLRRLTPTVWVSDTKFSSWSLSEHAFTCRAAVEIAFTLLFKLCMFIFFCFLRKKKVLEEASVSSHSSPPFSCEAAVVSVYWAGDFLHRCGDPGCLFLFSRRHLTAPWGTVTWKGSRVGRS